MLLDDDDRDSVLTNFLHRSMKLSRGTGRLGDAIIAVLGPFVLPALVAGQEAVDLRTLDLPRWSLEEELRLGSVDGEHDAFVRLVRMRVDDRGRLYVLDGGLPALRVFDPAGVYLRQIGRKGRGPGEYTAPGSFGFRGDTVWVMDGASRRVAFFGEDGRVLEDFHLEPAAPGMQPPQPVEVLGPDDFLVMVAPGPDRFLRGHGVGRVFFQQSMVRRNRSGTRVDTLATYTLEAGLLVTQADADGFSVIPYRPIRQDPKFSYDVERDELTGVQRHPATRSDRGEFRVTVRRPDGTVVADQRFVYRPVPLPESVRDSIRGELRSRLERDRAPGHEKRIEVGLEHLSLPDFLPPVSLGIVVGEDGTRWIAREALPGVIHPSYLITDAALNPLATVEFPPGARLAGPMDRDRVWLVEKDEWDVEYLVRYRIRRE